MRVKKILISTVFWGAGITLSLSGFSSRLNAKEIGRLMSSQRESAQTPKQSTAEIESPATGGDGPQNTTTLSSADESRSAVPPGYSTTRTGSLHDFDYFVGGWTTQQRRLKTRAVGSNDWEEFPGNLCMSLYLDGMATVDELYFPTKRSAGLTLRTFDSTKKQWSIYWVNSATGKLDPVPVVGGFEGRRGEFYAEDQDKGRPIKVRYMWTELDHDHARWEQAFSYDNRTWETNWVADFQRANTAAVCESGRPKR